MSFLSLVKRRIGLFAFVLSTANGVFSAVSAIAQQSHAMTAAFGIVALVCGVAAAGIGYWERPQSRDKDAEQGKPAKSNIELQVMPPQTIAFVPPAPLVHESYGPASTSIISTGVEYRGNLRNRHAPRHVPYDPSARSNGSGGRGNMKRRRPRNIPSVATAPLNFMKETVKSVPIPGLGDIPRLALEIVETVEGVHTNRAGFQHLARQSSILATFIVNFCKQEYDTDKGISPFPISQISIAIRLLEELRDFSRIAASRNATDRSIFVEADREIVKDYIKRLEGFQQQVQNYIEHEVESYGEGLGVVIQDTINLDAKLHANAETWAIGDVAQPREEVVSMEDVARSRAQVGRQQPRIVPLSGDDEDDATPKAPMFPKAPKLRSIALPPSRPSSRMSQYTTSSNASANTNPPLKSILKNSPWPGVRTISSQSSSTSSSSSQSRPLKSILKKPRIERRPEDFPNVTAHLSAQSSIPAIASHEVRPSDVSPSGFDAATITANGLFLLSQAHQELTKRERERAAEAHKQLLRRGRRGLKRKER